LCGAVQSLRQYGQLLGGSGLVFGVDGFVDAGDYYGCVAGELAWGVDGVAIPGAIGQAGFGDERGFGLAQDLIDVGRAAKAYKNGRAEVGNEVWAVRVP
jgi:hypothetical protein